LRVEPEPKGDPDRVWAGAQERDCAVHAATHRHGNTARLRCSPKGRGKRVRESVDRQFVAADGCGLEERQALERALQPLRLCADDCVVLYGKANERPASVAR
jgi:hypothetical protein